MYTITLKRWFDDSLSITKRNNKLYKARLYNLIPHIKKDACI